MAVTTSNGNGFALYNGVKLPDINTVWTDKTTYPYALAGAADGGALGVSASAKFGRLHLVATPLKYKASTDDFVNGDGSYISSSYFLSPLNQEASDILAQLSGQPVPLFSWFSLGSSDDGNSIPAPYTWASYDVLNVTDGSTYISASDPIPLDGMNVIEWDGDTTGLTDLSSVGIGGQYLVADTFVDFKDGDKYVCVFWNGDEYVTYPQHASLVYTKEEMGSETMWLLGTDVGNINFVGGYNIPSYGVVGTSFLGADPFYTALFAYPASSEPTYDRTAFLSGMAMGLCGKGNPTFEGSDTFFKGYKTGAALRRKRVLPVAYLYNGIALPKLPEWDKEAEPYAVIFQNGANNYCFWTGSSPVEVSNSGKVNGLFLEYRVAERWQWREKSKPFISTDAPLWANYDVYNLDGTTLLLAASDPTPLFTYPVFDDWLYNGEVLPALPEWDKTRYPYAFMLDSHLYVTAKMPYYKLSEDWMAWNIDDGVQSTRYYADAMRTAWFVGSSDTLVGQPAGLATWANFDVYDTDGNLCLAASEPIPVYE